MPSPKQAGPLKWARQLLHRYRPDDWPICEACHRPDHSPCHWPCHRRVCWRRDRRRHGCGRRAWPAGDRIPRPEQTFVAIAPTPRPRRSRHRHRPRRPHPPHPPGPPSRPHAVSPRRYRPHRPPGLSPTLQLCRPAQPSPAVSPGPALVNGPHLPPPGRSCQALGHLMTSPARRAGTGSFPALTCFHLLDLVLVAPGSGPSVPSE